MLLPPKITPAQLRPYKWIGNEIGRNKLPRWNFYKYLISPDGEIVASWSNREQPMSDNIRNAVERALKG